MVFEHTSDTLLYIFLFLGEKLVFVRLCLCQGVGVFGATPLKTNMSPENPWLEDVFPTEIVPFLGDMLVFGGVMFLILWGR